MEKRFEKIFSLASLCFAVGLGFWGYARVGSGYTAGGYSMAAGPPTYG
jgi:hypothetical protein